MGCPVGCPQAGTASTEPAATVMAIERRFIGVDLLARHVRADLSATGASR